MNSSEPESTDGGRESSPRTKDLVSWWPSQNSSLLFSFLAALLGGLLGAGGVAYMARQFKNKPKDMKISVYLIHTRMYAQMTVVGRSNQIDHQCCRPFSSLCTLNDFVQECFAAGCSVRCGNREKSPLVLLLVVIDCNQISSNPSVFSLNGFNILLLNLMNKDRNQIVL